MKFYLMLALVAALFMVSDADAKIVLTEDILAAQVSADDPRLRELGARAAREDLAVQVIAPEHWHGAIRAALDAGSNRSVAIKFRSTMIESGVIRLRTAEAPKPQPVANEPQPAPAVIERSEPEVVRQPTPAATATIVVEQTPPAPEPEPVIESAPAPVEPQQSAAEAALTLPSSGQVSSESGATEAADVSVPEQPAQPLSAAVEQAVLTPPSVVSQASASAESVSSPRPVEPEPAPVAEEAVAEEPVAEEPVVADAPINVAAEAEANWVKLSRLINQGKPLDKSLSVGDLERGDVIYFIGQQQAVRRTENMRTSHYRLDESISSDQRSLRRVGSGVYRVTGRVRTD